jgi:hypothetical protein
MIMTKGDNIGLAMLRDTLPNDLIGTIVEKIRIVLEKLLHHGQKHMQSIHTFPSHTKNICILIHLA